MRVAFVHTTWLECTRQRGESSFLVKVARAQYRKWKCGVKSLEPEIKCARNICFYLKILLGDHSVFLANSNRSVWRKVIQWNFCNSRNDFFSITYTLYWITFCHTIREVKEFRELSKNAIKRVGHRTSFSDNQQKLKFELISWTFGVPMATVWRHNPLLSIAWQKRC